MQQDEVQPERISEVLKERNDHGKRELVYHGEET